MLVIIIVIRRKEEVLFGNDKEEAECDGQEAVIRPDDSEIVSEVD